MTTNFQLARLLRDHPHFHGVYAENTLPKKLQEGGYIFNQLKNGDHRNGHWCAFYIFSGEPHVFYFDPLSLFRIPVDVERVLQANYSRGEIYYCPFREEAYDGVDCGQLCVKFLKECLQGEKQAYEYLEKHALGYGLGGHLRYSV